ncbi:MAG: phosphatase PAP2 family protein [Leptolyngbyaceae cyanobacterium SM2_5_2]|nr:phosphatase PAP2 family protein [Leptolyngbyaceae cyanobacterium SM2_5_2]
MKPIVLGVILPAAALVILGLVVAAYPALPAWDVAFLLSLHRYATPTLTQWIAILTNLGTVWGVLPATVGLMAVAFWHRRWWQGSYLALTMLGCIVLNPLAKQLWHRLRPALWDGIPPYAGFSFPSGHATYSMAFVLALVLLAADNPKRPWIVALGSLFVGFIGFSRVYLGVHFPSDILGGWLLATAWAVGLYQLMFRLWPGLLRSSESEQSSESG